MREGPDIARVAALIGDPGRAAMLCALMDGSALAAGELAVEAGVTKPTASGHLARLTEAGLLAVDVQGRHRYYRLVDDDVARALEALMGVADRGPGRRTRLGPRDPALRRARTCYDHLAGELAVAMMARMRAAGWLHDLALTERGRIGLATLGVDLGAIERARRPVCRTCLDWSARRHHLSGGAGRALFALMLDRGWVRREPGSRLVRVDRAGEAALASIAAG